MYFFTFCRLDNFGNGALAAYSFFKENIFLRLKKYTANYLIQAIAMPFIALYIINFLIISISYFRPQWFLFYLVTLF